MALSNDTEFRLDHAVTDDKISDEIAARVEVSSTPSNESEAQAILDLLDSSRNSAVAERLFTALAGDGDGAAGKELSRKINGMTAVLQAKANGDEITEENATGSLATNAAILLTDASGAGAGRNNDTVDLDVDPAAANPTDTILAFLSASLSEF